MRWNLRGHESFTISNSTFDEPTAVDRSTVNPTIAGRTPGVAYTS